ncbi:GH15 family glucan-1,4-alpha-glucosidase [Dokdonella fugitiva]|uniref:GH15 family glucan-1,4-alpha-glucosidase n=1 Tax=Dokdonella fugitiva TaxID=328517 RepID=A0A839ERL9_9GAMM|nr:glycoside hydrolase family 15 protein [Dokdonella fugitiva]MBA8887037.1 GH15 family glucan-1,4-alpha-glucosidase [Dokdonella fugitiva]
MSDGKPASLDLGVIGNGTIGALVDARGRIVWCCLPAFDGDPAFCALLSPRTVDAGWFDVALEGERRSNQRYVDNSAVLVTRLDADDGSAIEITDFAPRYKQYGRVFHPMAIVRTLRPLAGTPRVTLRLRPLTGYGARAPDRTSGSNHVRFVLEDGTVLRATTDAPLPMLRDELPFLLDREVHVLLGPDETLTESPAAHARAALEATLGYWREWVRYLSIPAEWQDAVIRAAITLKLCQYEGTGAIVAAMTTSIPEAPHTVRNWDYRYCWLRDAAFVVRALNRLGATRSMEEYLRYLYNLAAGADGDLGPVYGIHFERELFEREAEHLAGYRSMGPVRIGNDAWQQQQNDVYGSVVLAAVQLFFDRRLESPGDAAAFARLEAAGEAAWRLHDRPDAGLWEFRGRAHVHTYSAVMSWAACDRLSRIALHLGAGERAAFWSDRARRVRELILARAVHPRHGYFVDAFDSERLDASLLLLADLRFVEADDPRYIATVDAIGRELRQGDYLYRYVTADDFGMPETSFTICSFWYVEALAAIGRAEEARALFEQLLARRNPLGLLSEDVHPDTGELWGNFPQTYSLVGLINAAWRLSRSWESLL